VYQMDDEYEEENFKNFEYEDKNYENRDYTEDVDEFADDTELCLTFKQEFFALKSWVQGIAEAGLDALKIQSEIDSLTHALPIAQFIARNLIRVDPSYLMEFLNNIEKECRFEGQYHLPSLRANLIIALEAISDMDLFDEMHFDDYSDYDFKRYFYNSDERKFNSDYRLQFWQSEDPYWAPIDKKAKCEIVECLRFIAELDSDFLKHYENERIVRFCTANHIF